MSPQRAVYPIAEEPAETVMEPMTVREWRKSNPVIFPADAVPLTVSRVSPPLVTLLVLFLISGALWYGVWQGAVWGYRVMHFSLRIP